MTASTSPPGIQPDTDWAGLTLGQRIKHLEVEGYLVLPGMLGREQVAALHAQIQERIKTRNSDPTPLKQVARDVQFAGGALTELIANPPLIAFLKRLMGEPIIVMAYDYARSEPGAPAINLHSDGQPWGARATGGEFSCPRLVRCLYYLQDLTPDRAPFRVLPRTHLSFHAQGNPYLRYKAHPEQRMICCKAGDAVLINQNVLHGNYANRTGGVRELLAIAYRPAWAGPCKPVKEWDPAELAKTPPHVRALMGSRNTRVWDYEAPSAPPNMASEAPGIDPSRWDL